MLEYNRKYPPLTISPIQQPMLKDLTDVIEECMESRGENGKPSANQIIDVIKQCVKSYNEEQISPFVEDIKSVVREAENQLDYSQESLSKDERRSVEEPNYDRIERLLFPLFPDDQIMADIADTIIHHYVPKLADEEAKDNVKEKVYQLKKIAPVDATKLIGKIKEKIGGKHDTTKTNEFKETAACEITKYLMQQSARMKDSDIDGMTKVMNAIMMCQLVTRDEYEKELSNSMLLHNMVQLELDDVKEYYGLFFRWIPTETLDLLKQVALTVRRQLEIGEKCSFLEPVTNMEYCEIRKRSDARWSKYRGKGLPIG